MERWVADYSFRIRFNRTPTAKLNAKASELELAGDAGMPPLKLKSPSPQVSLEAAERIALFGSGYPSEEEAGEAGTRYRDALTVALARTHIGADFGARAAKGAFTKDGLALVQRATEARTLNNVHGLMVYETEPKPLFASMNSESSYAVSLQSFLDAAKLALERVKGLNEREQVAFTLFNAALFQGSADSRFMLLVMAVEVMLEPMARSEEATKHVDHLIALTKESQLSAQEMNSIAGALGWLRRESIGQAGRRLAREALGGRTYGGMAAGAFFSHAYTMRSNLAHGNLPLPTFEEVSATAADLERFVSDLLTTPYIGPPPT